MNKKTPLAIVTPVVLVTLLSPPVAAAEGVDDGLEEVMVTARKRSESILQVPVAITAFNAAALDNAGLTNLEEVSRFTPGLEFSKQADQNPARIDTSIRFRGMYINSVDPTQQLGSIFMDGIYIAGGVTGIGYENIERVEVIKGPQSAMFGRSTFGGAINYITRTPSNVFSGKVSALAATFGEVDLSASIEGPIVPGKLAARLTARSYNTDGAHRSSVDRGRMGEESTDAFNITLYATPTEAFEIKAHVAVWTDDDGAPAGHLMGSEPTGASLRNCISSGAIPPFRGQRDYFCGAIPVIESGQFGTNTIVDQAARNFIFNGTPVGPATRFVSLKHMGMRREAERYSLSVNYKLPGSGITLTSNTGYNQEDVDQIRDGDWDEAVFQFTLAGREFEDLSQEFRITSPEDGRLRWMVGANYYDLDYIEATTSRIPFTPTLVQVSAIPPATAKITNKAVFGSLGYDITETIKVSLEGRYQEEEADQGLIAPGVRLSKTFNAFLPRAILQFTPGREVNLYTSYAKGNTPGAFNSGFLTTIPASQRPLVTTATGATESVDEEELDSFELGWKQTVAEGRTSFSAVAYLMNWKNQKTRVAANYTNAQGLPAVANLLINAGETELWGLELEGNARATDRLTLAASFAYAGAEYKQFECQFIATVSGSNDCAGNRPPRFPEFSGTASATYTFPLADNVSGYARGDAIYFGKAYADEANLAWTEGYWRANLRIGVERDGLRLEAFVRNLFDDDSLEAASRLSDFTGALIVPFDFSQQGVMVTPSDGRQVGVRAIYSF